MRISTTAPYAGVLTHTPSVGAQASLFATLWCEGKSYIGKGGSTEVVMCSRG
jgi:hypothetical protein